MLASQHEKIKQSRQPYTGYPNPRITTKMVSIKIFALARQQYTIFSQSSLTNLILKNLSEVTQEMPQSRSTVLPSHHRKARLGNIKDKTEASYETTVAQRNKNELKYKRLGTIIMKTRLIKYIENLPPKTENFQIKNSGSFHISAQNVDCGYSLEPPWQGGSNEYSQSMFLSRS